ncbi:uncharacterized protein JCM15063_003242 [Sporobolomyces koalae]|uniref:uncharacterized protein n=1 Tax=Sporobolomyces koalae TaxID=500713 RepID=UPI00317E6B12
MTTLFCEPASPLLDYDEDQEPEVDGIRNLSVSTDGTLDSLDENPTPPGSPGPFVHVSPSGSKFPFSHEGRFFEFEESVFDKPQMDKLKSHLDDVLVDPLCTTSAPLPLSIRPPVSSIPSYSDIPSTPPAVRLAFPSLPSHPEQPVESLAERRASAGKLSNTALLSLQQMRFEASGDAGMGLGVGAGTPESVDYGGSSDNQPGIIFQLAMSSEDSNASETTSSARRSSLLAAPDLSSDGRTHRRCASTDSLNSLKPRSRSPLRTGRPVSFHSTSASSPPHSPATSRPASPLVKRTSAFVASYAGPLTPLTPSHVPGAPSIGSDSSAFNWSSYSVPESPTTPYKIPQFEQFGFKAGMPLTPSSDAGSITPTGRQKHSHGPSLSKLPPSPLGRGIFGESASAVSNPFFVPHQ